MFKKILSGFMSAFSPEKYEPIRNYGNLKITDPEYALDKLQVYYSDEYANLLWETACEKAGITEEDMTPGKLLKVYAYLAKQSDLAGVVGRSLFVKLKTYLQLQQKQAA